jgi:hypothetical protein
MPAKRAAIEIGKIEVKLAEEPENVSEDLETEKEEEKEEEPKAKPNPIAKVKKVSSAPEPIKPVRISGLTERDPSKMSPKEYRAWRESQKK